MFYIGERRGVVYAVSDERGDVVLDISDRTTTDRERGLLGLAFSPDGRRLYVSSTDGNGDSVIEEYLVDSDGVADVETRRTVITVEQPFGNHNGGQITFGPDGYLYYGLGDGGSGGDPDRLALDPSTLLGKLLRIDPMTPSGDLGYTIPATTRWSAAGARPEIWSSGLRNYVALLVRRRVQVTCGSAMSAKAHSRRSISQSQRRAPGAASASVGRVRGYATLQRRSARRRPRRTAARVPPWTGLLGHRRVRVSHACPASSAPTCTATTARTDLGGPRRRRCRHRAGRDRQRRPPRLVRRGHHRRAVRPVAGRPGIAVRPPDPVR